MRLSVHKYLLNIVVFLITLSFLGFYLAGTYNDLKDPDLGMTIDFPWGDDESPEIVMIKNNGPAHHAGLNVGDTILRINDYFIESKDDFEKIDEIINSGKNLKLLVETGSIRRNVSLKVGFNFKHIDFVKSIFQLITIIFSWFLFAVCYFKGIDKVEIRILAFVCLAIFCKFCISAPSLTSFFDDKAALFSQKNFLFIVIRFATFFFVHTFLYSSLLHLFLIFPRKNDLKRKNFVLNILESFKNHIYLIYLLPNLLLVVFFFGKYLPFIMRHITFGKVLTYFYTVVLLTISIGMTRFILIYRQDEDKIKRSQERIILFSVLFFTFCQILVFVLIHFCFSESFFQYIFQFLIDYGQLITTLGFIVLLSGFTLAIFKFKLFQIERIVTKTLLNFIMITFSIVLFTTIEGLTSQALTNIAQSAEKYVSLGSSIVVAILFTPVRNRIDSFIKVKF